MNGDATHAPLLALAHLHTKGPVVEIGSGWNSTPMLFGMSKATKRKFLSYDESKEWVKVMQRFGTRYRWKMKTIPPIKCGLLFLDGPYCSKDRGEILTKWKDFADVIVIHDTQPEASHRYNYDLEQFPYCHTTKFHRVWSSAVSNEEIKWAKNIL